MGFGDRDALVEEGLFGFLANALDQVFDIVLHVTDNFGHRITLDDVFDLVAFGGELDVDGICISKQVVEIAHDLLVRTTEE